MRSTGPYDIGRKIVKEVTSRCHSVELTSRHGVQHAGTVFADHPTNMFRVEVSGHLPPIGPAPT